MGKFVDLTGMKFGRWEVLKRVENRGKNTMYLCKCSCEKQTEKIVGAKHLRSGSSKSCGCTNITHGLSYHPLFKVYGYMIQRCINSNNKSYVNYGGRGIKVCEEWQNDFKVFYDWCIENGWQKGLHIDKIDNDGDYCPENCQFITHAENNAIGKQRKKKNNTSGFVGVHFCKNTNKWQAYIRINGKKISCGSFSCINNAVKARIAKEIEIFGEQKTNFHFKEESNT